MPCVFFHVELAAAQSYNKTAEMVREVNIVKAFEKLAPNIYRLAVTFPGCWAGATLVMGEENVLVDTGGCSETVDSDIVPALAQLGLTVQDVHWMALTHIHGDHVGGCARLKQLNPAMKVAVFADSQARLLEPLRYSKAIRARFPEYSPAAPKVLDGVKADLLLQDGDFLGHLRLLHTPGHDTDACCYLDERSMTLITGDSLQQNGTVSQGCALLMDAEGYEKTLNRLLHMPIENIVCGHPYLPMGAQAIGAEAARRYLEGCLACAKHDEGFVHGMMAAGVANPAAIARALIREVGGQEPACIFLPLYTVTEYMKKGVQRQ